MLKHNGILGVIVIFITIILQSTILNNLSINDIKPDLVMIMILLFSNNSGKIKGQFLGFSVGLVEDFLSLAPLGFNAFLHTIIGYLAGSTSGKIFFDPIVVPIVFILIGTLLKSVLSFILLSLFLTEKVDSIFTSALLLEIGLNVIITPFIYLLFKLIRVFPSSKKSRII